MDKFIETLEQFHMLSASETVLVALSGGADSVSLLHRFVLLRKTRKLTVLAGHVNHSLRGDEADRDEAFCRTLCEAWSVPFLSTRVDVKGEAENTGESVEECARRLRYAFLEAQAEKHGALLATAHTADDNLETVLLNLIRGTGLKGLCGIPPVRGRIIRPLLFCERAEIEAYCKAHGLSYVTDSSNLSGEFARNQLRLSVTPVLKSLNPSLLSGISRMTRFLREEEELLETLAQNALSAAKRDGGFDAAALAKLPPPLRFRALAQVAKEAGGSIGAAHEPAVTGILLKGGSTDLPGGVRMTVQCGRLTVDRKKDGQEKPFLPVTALAVPGETKVGGRWICTQKLERNGQNVYNFLFYHAFDYAKIKGSLRARSRRSGDKLALSRRNCTKSLKKLFQEANIPPKDRDAVVVVEDDEGIVWVEGFGCDRRVRTTGETNSLLLLDVREEDGL